MLLIFFLLQHKLDSFGPWHSCGWDLTCTIHLKNIADQLHLLIATALTDVKGPPQQDSTPCHTTKTAEELGSVIGPYQCFGGWFVSSAIRMNARTQCLPAEHYIEMILGYSLYLFAHLMLWLIDICNLTVSIQLVALEVNILR